eukprot:272863_1
MSLLPTVVVVFFSFFTFSFSSTINPSVSNSSGDYYISSKTTLASQAITCSSSNCHIICDTTCQNIAISASQSSSLTIDCLNVASCKKAQLKSGPTDTITINCLAKNACAEATFQFNSTSNADITCRYNATHEQVRMNGTTVGSCKSARFYGHDSNEVSVDCNGFDCYQTVFHVNNSDTAAFRMHNPSFMSYTKTTIFGGHITNALIIQCLHSNSCRENNIYCPRNGRCDLHCKEQFACAQNIYISDKSYNHLYVNLSSGALYDTDIHCVDSSESDIWSIMKYRGDAKEWGCADYTPRCCPIFHTLGDTITTCKSGVDCIATCAPTAPCANDVIDAADASSLVLKCEGDRSCEGKSVICHGSSCEILCDGVGACKDLKVRIQDSNALNISCTQDLSCVGLHVWPRQYETIHIDNVLLSCEAMQSCANVTVGYGTVVGTLDVQCTGIKSCEGMAFLGHSMMYVGMTGYTAISVTNRLTMNCGASLACHKLSASLVSSAQAQNRIICNNPSVSANKTGACYQSKFDLYGDSQHVSDWKMSCNAFDCQRIAVSTSGGSPGKPINMLQMECDAPYSCASSRISVGYSNELRLECTDEGSCFDSMVRGSSKAAESTQIVCGEAANSCASMTIDSPLEFAEEYVALTCPDGKEHKSSCDNIKFECDTNYYPYGHKQTCYLHYDACAAVEDGAYHAYGEELCCPIRQRSEHAVAAEHSNTIKNNSNATVLGIIFGCILVVVLVVCLLWCSFKQNKKRVDANALLAEIHDDSEERSVDIVVDDQQASSYAPPSTAGSTTELIAQ